MDGRKPSLAVARNESSSVLPHLVFQGKDRQCTEVFLFECRSEFKASVGLLCRCSDLPCRSTSVAVPGHSSMPWNSVVMDRTHVLYSSIGVGHRCTGGQTRPIYSLFFQLRIQLLPGELSIILEVF